MIISFFRELDSWYASRISEYVIPPATNTIKRWRLSGGAFTRGDLCQFAFALRSDVACGGGGASGLADAADRGASFT